MANRTAPYGAFNFLVNFDGDEAFGGFSDVSGLTLEIPHAEYRAGNDPVNHVRKIPGIHRASRPRRTSSSACSTSSASRCRRGRSRASRR